MNVATGVLFQDHSDHVIPGRMPLAFERRFSSAVSDTPGGMFGPGWSSPFETHLQLDVDGVLLVRGKGETTIAFDGTADELLGGKSLRNLGSFHELGRTASRLVVTRWPTMPGDVTRFIFGPTRPDRWHLESIENGRGSIVDLVRDAAGRVVGVFQRREARGYHLVYDRSDRLVQVRFARRHGSGGSPSGPDAIALLTYDYDSTGRLRSMRNALGGESSYEYDTAGRLVRETTLCGMDYTFGYDRRGRCVETSGRAGYDAQRLAFDDIGRLTLVTDSLGRVRTFSWNEAGQVLQETSPLGSVERTSYDAHGRIVQVEDANGATVRYAYDENGNRCQITAKTGAVTQIAHDAQHRFVAITDPEGFEWSRELDGAGRTLSITAPNGETWQYRYDRAGDLTAVEAPNGAVFTYTWDAAGDLVGVTDALGGRVALEYDSRGHMVAFADALGYRTECERDLFGRVRRIRHPDTSSRSYEYDPVGQRTAIVNEAGEIVRMRYGGCGQLAEVLRPDGTRFVFEWSTVPGVLYGIVNPNGERCSYEYDADGRVVRRIDFAGRATEFEYEGASLRAVTFGGERTVYARSPAGLVLQAEYADGSIVAFEYDKRGLVTAARVDDHTIEWKYDGLNRPVRERQGRHEIAYEYEPYGCRPVALRRRRTSSLGGATEYDWDANGQLVALQTNGSEPVRFARDARQDETLRYVRGGVGIERGLDGRGRQLQQQVGARRQGPGEDRGSSAALSLLRRQYRYDAAGRLVREEDSAGRVSQYDYDPNGRILRAILPDRTSIHYEFDAADNVRAANGSRQERPAEEYDFRGRLVRRTDARGTVALSWNSRNQLTGVVLPDGRSWQYHYDAFGRRVRKSGPDGEVEFVWDAEVLLHERRLSPDGQAELQTWEFEPFGYRPICVTGGGRRYLAVTDQNGTPRELVSDDGAVAWSAVFAPYGSILQSRVDAIRCALRRPGQWHDEETGLYYNRFRYYDPVAGHYISPDPIGLLGGPNPTRYTPDPINWSDPTGLAVPICPQRAQQIADEFEKTFGQKPDEIYLVGSWAEAEANGQWPADPYSGPGKSDIDIYIVTSVPDADKGGGPGFAFFSAVNPGQIPPGVTGVGMGPGQALITNEPGGIPKANLVDPFFGPKSGLENTPDKPAIKIWP